MQRARQMLDQQLSGGGTPWDGHHVEHIRGWRGWRESGPRRCTTQAGQPPSLHRSCSVSATLSAPAAPDVRRARRCFPLHPLHASPTFACFRQAVCLLEGENVAAWKSCAVSIMILVEARSLERRHVPDFPLAFVPITAPTQGPAAVGVTITCLLLAWATVFLRIWTRATLINALGMDDYIIIVAAVSTPASHCAALRILIASSCFSRVTVFLLSCMLIWYKIEAQCHRTY
jgi:hypothetical protein